MHYHDLLPVSVNDEVTTWTEVVNLEGEGNFFALVGMSGSGWSKTDNLYLNLYVNNQRLGEFNFSVPWETNFAYLDSYLAAGRGYPYSLDQTWTKSQAEILAYWPQALGILKMMGFVIVRWEKPLKGLDEVERRVVWDTGGYPIWEGDGQYHKAVLAVWYPWLDDVDTDFVDYSPFHPELWLWHSANMQNYHYWGDYPLGKTWAYVHSCSDLTGYMIGRANMETLCERLIEVDPEGETWVRHGYNGAVGTGEHLMVQMYDERGHITPACQIALQGDYDLEQYPILDEDKFSDMEYEENWQYVLSEVKGCHLRKRVPSVERITTDVIRYLDDHNIEQGEDAGATYRQIHTALRDLGYLMLSMYDENDFDPLDSYELQQVEQERYAVRQSKKV